MCIGLSEILIRPFIFYIPPTIDGGGGWTQVWAYKGFIFIHGMTQHFLNDCWSLYFHDPDENDWSESSYIYIGTISSVQDWQSVDVSFNNLWGKGMFFLMREHIKPLWEDTYNKNGGCLSFKVNKPEVASFWYKIAARALGETLTRDVNQTHLLNGLSISPKRNYCIIRIWIAEASMNSIDKFDVQFPEYTQVIYKSHSDNNDYAKNK
jgi:Eukaryotic initiation factor 4E